MIKDLVIFGAGALGRYAVEVAEAMNEKEPTWKILGYLDDNENTHGRIIMDYPVLGGKSWLSDNRNTSVIIALGNPADRRKVADWLADQGLTDFATLIHPATVISKRSHIGPGSIVCPGVVIDAQTEVGKHVVLNKNSTVGHDAKIADCVNLSPSGTLTGNDTIEEGCIIGSNATVIPGIKIGSWSIIGAGSVVNKDLPEKVTAVGVPAKIIKQNA